MIVSSKLIEDLALLNSLNNDTFETVINWGINYITEHSITSPLKSKSNLTRHPRNCRS